MTRLTFPAICHCGFNTMDAEAAATHSRTHGIRYRTESEKRMHDAHKAGRLLAAFQKLERWATAHAYDLAGPALPNHVHRKAWEVLGRATFHLDQLEGAYRRLQHDYGQEQRNAGIYRGRLQALADKGTIDQEDAWL